MMYPLVKELAEPAALGLGNEEASALMAKPAEIAALDDAGRARRDKLLGQMMAQYMLRARTSSGRVIDPVARFHLQNGARLERINPAADLSRKGVRQSHGFMVNYLYDLDRIESNHEAFIGGKVSASRGVTGLI